MAAARMIPLAQPKMSHTPSAELPLPAACGGGDTRPAETFIGENANAAATTAATIFNARIIAPQVPEAMIARI